MNDKILDSIAYILPAAVTGFVAYYMFKSFLTEQNNERKMELLASKKKEGLPIKIQAYERLLLFCNRMNPPQIIQRVQSISDDVKLDLELLLKTIHQEFEHNLVQQLYVSDDAWKAILSTKTIIENQLKQIADSSKTSEEFRSKILLNATFTSEKIDVVNTILKNEVKKNL